MQIPEGVIYIFLMSSIGLAGMLVARFWPFYRNLLASEQPNHYRSLDGLRGVLAFIHMALHRLSSLHRTALRAFIPGNANKQCLACAWNHKL
jgi:hypothetical protein